MNGRTRKQIVSILFGILCMAGFVYQVIHISVHFFQFKTSTRVHQGVVDLLPAPNVVICFRYNELFNNSRYLADFKKQKQGLDKIHRNITVREVFRYSPKAARILSTLWYRESDSFVLRNATSESIRKIFRFSRYIIQDQICYRLHRRKKHKVLFTFPRLTYSLHFPGIFYELILDPYFTRAQRIRLMIMTSDEYPYLSHIYSAMVIRTDDVKGRDANISSNNLLFTYRHLVHHLLPKPWDTGCIHKEFSYTDCRSCYNRFLDPVNSGNKVPFMEYIVYTSSMSLVSEKDLENRTIDKAMIAMVRNCKAVCDQKPCVREFSVTSKTLSAAVRSPSPSIRIKILSPSNPPIVVTTERKISLKEYFTYITSCFGLWFGLSIATVSPFNHCYHRLKRKRRKRPTTTLLTRLFM